MLIDTHAHLDEDSFDVDRADVVDRAAAAGVVRIITIGTTAPTSRRAVEIAAQFSPVFAAVGIQPNYAAQARAGDWDEIVKLAGEPKVVAIGETGLDRYWDYAPIELQREYFRQHLELARQLDLPFVVHCRDAEADVVDELRLAAEAGALRGVMHSFSGSAATARDCVALGLHISFAGMVTFKKNEVLRNVAREIPPERILVETDSPYLAPQPMRGKRNEPANVVVTANSLAETLGMSREEFARQSTRNACDLFRLKIDE